MPDQNLKKSSAPPQVQQEYFFNTYELFLKKKKGTSLINELYTECLTHNKTYIYIYESLWALPVHALLLRIVY